MVMYAVTWGIFNVQAPNFQTANKAFWRIRRWQLAR